MTARLAIDVHGACPRCTTDKRQVWHFSGCDRWAAAEERERPVACFNIGCRRLTIRNDGACSDECAAEVREFAARSRRGQSVGVHAPTGQVGGRGLDGCRDSSPASFAPAASSDQARSGGIFAGFLSKPVGSGSSEPRAPRADFVSAPLPPS